MTLARLTAAVLFVTALAGCGARERAATTGRPVAAARAPAAFLPT